MIDAINLSFLATHKYCSDLSESYISYSTPVPNPLGIINLVLHKNVKVVLSTSDDTLTFLDENNLTYGLYMDGYVI
jgi:hypothetical protein